MGCIVLGRGEDDTKVREWLATAAHVAGFIGFAVGRTTFWDPLIDCAGKEDQRARPPWLKSPAATGNGWTSSRRPVLREGDDAAVHREDAKSVKNRIRARRIEHTLRFRSQLCNSE